MPRVHDLKINREKARVNNSLVSLSNARKGDTIWFRNGKQLVIAIIDKSKPACSGDWIVWAVVNPYGGPLDHAFSEDGLFCNSVAGGWRDPAKQMVNTLSEEEYHGWDIIEVIKGV